MSVDLEIRHCGTYRRLKNGTGIINGQKPRKLNEDPRYYGRLSAENQLDLKLGHQNWKDEGAGERLDSILMYIDQISSDGDSLKSVTGSDFVCARGLLHAICSNWNDPKKILKFEAHRVKDVIFLSEVKDRNPEGWNDKFTYYGYKFEHYMTLNEDGVFQNKFETALKAEKEKVVCRTKISMDGENIHLMYAAEVDAINQENEYVELKTTKGAYSEKGEAKKVENWYKYRSLKVFFQSYLGGIQNIVIGRWKYAGIVYKVDHLKVNDIATSPMISWNKDECMRILFNVLKEIKKRLTENDTALIVKTLKNPSQPLFPQDRKIFTYTTIETSEIDIVPSYLISKYE